MAVGHVGFFLRRSFRSGARDTVAMEPRSGSFFTPRSLLGKRGWGEWGTQPFKNLFPSPAACAGEGVGGKRHVPDGAEVRLFLCPSLPQGKRGGGEWETRPFKIQSPLARPGRGDGGEGRAQHNQPLQRSSTTGPQRAQHAVPLRTPALGSCEARHSHLGRSVFLPCPSFPPGKEGLGRMGALTFQNSFPLARRTRGRGGRG